MMAIRRRLKALLLGTAAFLIIRLHIEIASLPKDASVSRPSFVASATTSPRPENNIRSQNRQADSPSPASPSPSPAASPPHAAAVSLTYAQDQTCVTPKNSGDASKNALPKGFVYLSEALPETKLEIRYATTHNFTGQVVDGYLSGNTCLTVEAANALKKASALLKQKGYGILIYDAYRPKRAAAFFAEWGKSPEDNLAKAEFYPHIEKKDLFRLGYIARRSAHSRGSAVDLTLYDLETGKIVDMGSPYDFLDPISNHGTKLITEAQTENRNILKEAMKASGFRELKTEWWHYQLIDEPYPNRYFDFVIN